MRDREAGKRKGERKRKRERFPALPTGRIKILKNHPSKNAIVKFFSNSAV